MPVARGLGSSATLLAAGAMAANHFLGAPLAQDEILSILTELEGHPDNVAPALLGGLVVIPFYWLCLNAPRAIPWIDAAFPHAKENTSSLKRTQKGPTRTNAALGLSYGSRTGVKNPPVQLGGMPSLEGYHRS